MTQDPQLHLLLLAGGSGTRLWPLSREELPKQFLALTDSRSLLQDTVLRVLRLLTVDGDIPDGTEIG